MVPRILVWEQQFLSLGEGSPRDIWPCCSQVSFVHVLIHSDFNSCPRSGLAVKHHIDIGAGVVDEDYRGNLGWNTFIINLGFLFKLLQRKFTFSLKSECKLNFRIAGVVMFNHASVDFEVKAGDRIAQLVCERIAYPDIQVTFTL